MYRLTGHNNTVNSTYSTIVYLQKKFLEKIPGHMVKKKRLRVSVMTVRLDLVQAYFIHTPVIVTTASDVFLAGAIFKNSYNKLSSTFMSKSS